MLFEKDFRLATSAVFSISSLQLAQCTSASCFASKQGILGKLFAQVLAEAETYLCCTSSVVFAKEHDVAKPRHWLFESQEIFQL